MNLVLDIVKRYLFEIICGACAVVGITLGAWGFRAMANVTEDMEGALRIQNEIATMARKADPINAKAVQLAQERIEQIRANYRDVMAFVRELDEFEPLTPAAFPIADAADRVRFQEAYLAEVGRWLGILHAGDVPSADDIAQERDRMEAEAPVDETLGADPDDEDDGRGADRKKKAKSPQESAEVRAAIRKAKSIYCYATADSFQDSRVSAPDGPMYDAARPPSMVQMWHAQLEVWVQRSVVDAIAEINSAEAERLQAEAERATDELAKKKLAPWVGNLPIKEVVSIQTSTYYVTKEGKGHGGGGARKDRAYPPGPGEAVFTGNVSNDLYELMRFSVQLVVDARDIPRIVSDLCRGTFHSPLRVSYKAIPPNLSLQGKIYGDEPVVMLTIDFETVFFSDLYLPLMPDKILEELGKKRPEPADTEET